MGPGLRLYSWGAVEIDKWHSELVQRVGWRVALPPARVGLPGPTPWRRRGADQVAQSCRGARGADRRCPSDDVVTTGEDTFNVGAGAPADSGLPQYGDFWRRGGRSPVRSISKRAFPLGRRWPARLSEGSPETSAGSPCR